MLTRDRLRERKHTGAARLKEAVTGKQMDGHVKCKERKAQYEKTGSGERSVEGITG